MSVERIIGIDFGTSTSVMRVKRYRENGQSVDDRLYTAEVKFGNSSLVPTLIREMQTGEPYYGYDAQKEHKKSTLFDNFKVELESPDPQEREQARALTEAFFTYLSKQYKDQSAGGFFGEADETERTIVSYPVKWSEETRRFMLDAAKKAGFKNVEGMDEAQAAITAVMVQSADYLSQRGYLHDGVPANILMADMGAGTTDLVLCRYTPGKSATYEILSAWPKDGGALFGGREVEGMLREYLRGMLPEEDADTVMKRCGLGKLKSWKEDYVSPALGRMEAVTEFYEFDERIEDLDIEIEEYAIDRDEFEKMAAAYLKEFPMLMNGCLGDAGLSGDEVDLVLLTGGHSQWYFVKEQLCGKLERFGAVGLGKIQADPERIIPVPRPQETVALGLVYSPLMGKIRFASKLQGTRDAAIVTRCEMEVLEKNRAKLIVEVAADVFEDAVEQAYQNVKNKIMIPGLGWVKVPRIVIEKAYGSEVFYEDAAMILISKAYTEAVDMCSEEIVSQPAIDVIQIGLGKPFIFTAQVALKPKVVLGKYKGVKIETDEVDEERIIDAIIADARMDIPEEMLTTQPDPQAERQIKSRLVLEAVAEAENIEVSEEEYQAEVRKKIGSYNMEIEEVIKSIDRKEVIEDIKVQKALKFVVRYAKK